MNKIALVIMILSSGALADTQRGGISCLRGVPFVSVYHGNGPGCGESDSSGIESVTMNPLAGVIDVVTYPIPGKGTSYCHYWGPVFGGGQLPHSLAAQPAIWTISVDGDSVPGVFLLGTEYVGGKVIPTCEVVR